MRALELKVFTINELDEKVQERVIERYRNNDGWCWSSTDEDILYDEFSDMLKGTPFEDCKIDYRLSHCQGDGVKLTGQVDGDILYKECEKSGCFKHHELRRIKYILDYVRFELVDGYYYHSYTNNVSYNDYNIMYNRGYEEFLEPLLPMIEEFVLKLADEKCEDMVDLGCSVVEFNYSDERILKELLDNEYEFTEDGRDFI